MKNIKHGISRDFMSAKSAKPAHILDRSCV